MSNAASSTALEGITRMMSAASTYCVKAVGHTQLLLCAALTAGWADDAPFILKTVAKLYKLCIALSSIIAQGNSSVAEYTFRLQLCAGSILAAQTCTVPRKEPQNAPALPGACEALPHVAVLQCTDRNLLNLIIFAAAEYADSGRTLMQQKCQEWHRVASQQHGRLCGTSLMCCSCMHMQRCQGLTFPDMTCIRSVSTGAVTVLLMAPASTMPRSGLQTCLAADMPCCRHALQQPEMHE